MEIYFRLRAGYDSRDMQLVLTRANYPSRKWEFCGRDKNAYCVPALHGGASLPKFKTKHEAELWAIDNRLPAFAVWNGRKRSYDGQGAIIRADAPPRDMEAEQAAKYPYSKTKRPPQGARIEIPVHYNAWMQGARFGRVGAFRNGRAGQSDFVFVTMDHPQIKKPLKLWRPDWEYCKAI